MNAETSTASAVPPRWLRGRFARWIFATDHKQLGLLWLGVGAVGIALGGVLSLVSALQQSQADAAVVGEGTFASVATMQGTLLTSVGILPLALGLALAVVPLQIGARGVVAPGVAAAGLWFGVVGATATVLSSFAPGDAPRSWWTSVPQLALAERRPGESIRLMGLLLLAVGALLTAVVLVLTLRDRRATGVTWDRVPLFSQSAGVFAGTLLVLAPLAILADLLLLLARSNDGFDWYVTDDGGLLHGYGWVFQQGLVACALVPALGAAAEVVATFARGGLRARRPLSLGLVATAVLVALTPSADTVDQRTWATVLALLAAGAAAGVATLGLAAGLRAVATRRVEAISSPLPLALGALVLTLAGALVTVVFLVRHDELSGTTFESARLAVLLVAALAGLAAGAVYWCPKLTGRALDPRPTAVAALVLTGSGLLLALGRAGAGWAGQPSHTGLTTGDAQAWALLGSLGVAGVAAALGLLGLALAAAARGRRVGNDPWLGDTLEWYTASPPPPWNFDSLPPVESDRPLADLRQGLRDTGAL